MGDWSANLIEQTKNKIYPGAMMKCSDGRFGMLSSCGESGVTIVGTEFRQYMPVSTDEVIAEYADIDEMIAAGWVID